MSDQNAPQPTPDYEALAKQFGGSVVQPTTQPAAQSAAQPVAQPVSLASQPAPAIDLEALARQHGGEVVSNQTNATAPQTSVQSAGQPTDQDSAVEQYKSQKWQNAWNHVKNGNMVAAGHELAGLFTNPYAEDHMDIAKGVAEGAGQTITTAADLAHKVLPAVISNAMGAEAWRTPEMRQREVAATPGEKAGQTAETIGEFILGDELAAGAKLGDAILKSKKIAETLKTAPEMLPWVEAALRTGRVAAVSAAQSAAHAPEGERASAAMTGAEYGAAGGAAGELLGAGARYFAAKTPEAIEALAKEDAEAQFLKDHQVALQAGAKAADTATVGLNNAAAEAADRITGYEQQKIPATRVAGDGAQIDASSPDVQKGLRRAIGSYTFNDAANDVFDHAKPVFEEIDKISNDDFSTLREQQDTALKVIRNSASMDAVKGARASLDDATKKIGQIFNDANDRIVSDPEASTLTLDDLKAAQADWRKGSTLAELHSRLDRAFTVPEAAQKLAGIPATVDPKKFKMALDGAVRQIGQARLEDALGYDGVKNLYDVNKGVSKMLDNAKFNKAATSYVNAAVNRAVAAMPKPSGSSTLSYGISPIIGGASIGAGVGALSADEGSRQEGALKGAMVGGLAGGAASVPVGLAHWFYTHPIAAVKAFEFASKVAPAASQAAKQMQVTHIFSPQDGTLMPVQQPAQ